jgi:hypothetical protein
MREVLDYLHGAASIADFENAPFVMAERTAADDSTAEEKAWEDLSEGDKPSISVADPESMKNEIKQLRYWKQFVETGKPPDSDSESEDGDKGQ